VRSPVVKQGSDSKGKALAKPTEFECVWCDRGTGGDKDGSLWKAHAPAGYVALSDVAVQMSNSGVEPGTTQRPDDVDPSFRCVHASLVKDAELDACVWTDAGSGGKYDGACWGIQLSPGMRVSTGGGDSPDNQQYQLKEFTGSLYKDMKLIYSVANPLAKDQPDSKYSITVGCTTTTGSEMTLSAEFGVELTQKFSAGVEGICSSETAAKFSAKLGSTSTFSSQSTSTRTEQLEVPFRVEAKSRTELWQAVVTDSQAGAGSGSFLIHSEVFELRYIGL